MGSSQSVCHSCKIDPSINVWGIDFTNINCEDHLAFCCRFCKSCDKVVCPTCVAEGHKSHDLMEIINAYEQKHLQVKKYAFIKNVKLLIWENIVRHLEQFRSLQNDKMASVEKKMDDYKKSLNGAMDIHIDKLISDLKSKKEEVLEAVNNDIKKIKQGKQIVQTDLQVVVKLMTTKDSTEFFTGISKMDELMNTDVHVPMTPSVLMSIPRFVPKDIKISDTGELQRDSDTGSSCDQIKLQIIEQYQSELAVIDYTCPCTDGSLWIGIGIQRTVQRVRPDTNKLKVISTINTPVYGMTSTESGDLLISTEGTRLQQISCKSGQISDTQYDVAPFDSTAIHITQEGKVIVAGIDQVRTAVFVMDTDGRHERVYDHDSHGKPLFTYPLDITSTMNGNIHVVDDIPRHDRGRLVVLSQGGDIINIYSGHPDVNKVTTFCPVCIATTPGDNVIVVDLNIQHLHLLDNTGHLLTVYKTKDAGIQYPDSLAFTSSGSLWIGCGQKRGSTEKSAKLYHVTISGN